MLAEALPRPKRHLHPKLRPHQFKIASSSKPLILAGMGIGSGKTHTGTAMCLKWASDSVEGVSHIIAANSYTQLFDSTLANLYKNLTEYGVAFKPDSLPESTGGYGPWNLHIWNGRHWVLFRCRSLIKWEKISGQEAGCAWIDEAWDSPEAGYNVIGDRCRNIRMPYHQRLITTTLDDPSSWLYRIFVENHESSAQGTGKHWNWSESPGQLVVYAATSANAKNLPDEYLAGRLAEYSDREAERMIGSGPEHTDPPKWVSTETGLIYTPFNRALHITDEAEFDPALPILWTWDFNIAQGKPMSSALCQVKRGKFKGKARTELHTFDELILDSTDTRDAIAEFFARGWIEKALGDDLADYKKIHGEDWRLHWIHENVTIYGDASGRAKDTRSKTTDYQLLTDAGFVRQKVPKANPPIRTRHNICRALLKAANGDVRARIHSRCRTLAKGLETVKLRKGAQYLEEETREQHVTTAWGYLACVEFPPAAKVGGGGSLIRRAR